MAHRYRTTLRPAGFGGLPSGISWRAMIERCSNPRHIGFKYYGGRGVTVCDRWRASFADFLADMGTKPTPRHSIDRYPNAAGNYEPSNCRWATPGEQRANQRKYDEAQRVQRSWDTGKRSRISHARADLTGQRFGRLLVVRYSDTQNRRARWLCRCDCGNEAIIAGKSLRSGATTSCGCRNREVARDRAIVCNLTDNPAKRRLPRER